MYENGLEKPVSSVEQRDPTLGGLNLGILCHDFWDFFSESVDVHTLAILLGACLSYGMFKWVIPNRHVFYASLVIWLTSAFCVFFIGLDPEGYFVGALLGINIMAAGFFWLSLRDDYPE